MHSVARPSWSSPVSAEDLAGALTYLGARPERPVIVHASLSAFGQVSGGAPAVVQGLRQAAGTVLAPAFTYYSKVWPPEHRASDWPARPSPDGPPFRLDARVSAEVGRVPQALLELPGALRSAHPALSFAAVGPGSNALLAPQTLAHPYAPIGVLHQLDGDVLLLGVDHTANTSVHYAEHLAGRPLLRRFLNGPDGIVSAAFPNCSAGFGAIEPRLGRLRSVRVGRAIVQRVPVRDVVSETLRLIEADPEALLCQFSACRCQAVRAQTRLGALRPRDDGLFAG